MKSSFLKIGFYAIMFAMTLFATSCESGEHGDHEGHDHDHQHQHEQSHDHNHEGHDHEGHQHQQEETSSIDKTGKEYTSAYICPMHCEGSGSDAEGKCPVCKMDYEENTTM